MQPLLVLANAFPEKVGVDNGTYQIKLAFIYSGMNGVNGVVADVVSLNKKVTSSKIFWNEVLNEVVPNKVFNRNNELSYDEIQQLIRETVNLGAEVKRYSLLHLLAYVIPYEKRNHIMPTYMVHSDSEWGTQAERHSCNRRPDKLFSRAELEQAVRNDMEDYGKWSKSYSDCHFLQCLELLRKLYIDKDRQGLNTWMQIMSSNEHYNPELYYEYKSLIDEGISVLESVLFERVGIQYLLYGYDIGFKQTSK